MIRRLSPVFSRRSLIGGFLGGAILASIVLGDDTSARRASSEKRLTAGRVEPPYALGHLLFPAWEMQHHRCVRCIHVGELCAPGAPGPRDDPCCREGTGLNYVAHQAVKPAKSAASALHQDTADRNRFPIAVRAAPFRSPLSLKGGR